MNDSSCSSSPLLLVLNGPMKGQYFNVVLPRCWLGRSPSCQIVIDDPAMSGFHCSIELIGNHLFISDLASTNGTKLNGCEVGEKPVRLKSGDNIFVGETFLNLRLPNSIKKPPSPQSLKPSELPQQLSSAQKQLLRKFAWRRWSARLIDFELCRVVFRVSLFGLSYVIPFRFTQDNIDRANLVWYFLYFLMESGIYAIFGNTIGKKLMGIVISKNGVRISSSQYLIRNLCVYLRAFWLWILFPIPFFLQYRKVKSGLETSYDKSLGFVTSSSGYSKSNDNFGFALFLIFGIAWYLADNLLIR